MLAKLLRVLTVYDVHDLSPELYLSRMSKKKGVVYSALLLAEKLSCKSADIIITTNHSYEKRLIKEHGVPEKKILIVRNDPSIADIAPSEGKLSAEDNHGSELIFVGAINPQDGVESLMEVVRILVEERGRKKLRCRILGKGDSLETVKEIAAQKHLTDNVIFEGFVAGREKVRKYLRQAMVGVEPAGNNPVNRLSTFIKIMEYMAAGIPIVAFDLGETRYSSQEAAILVAPGDLNAFANGIEQLLEDANLRRKLGNAGKDRIRSELNWEEASRSLIRAYQMIM